MSDKKLTIEELEQKVLEADAVAEMKSNFLATMSHEIRTPMQSIYGLLELIADEKPNDKIAEMVKTAQTSASGLLEILDDVLDFAKMDADKMELDSFEVPVRLLVRGLLEALAVKVHGVNVELIDEIEEEVPFVVAGDPKRLRQIIMNLCGNALKFTKEGTVKVRVTSHTQHVKPKNDKDIALRFEVIDSGIGMSQEVCDKLFGAFVQADNSTQRKYGGTGLGLSISKKLVELMHGKIGVESVEGEGSTFWFEIPTREVKQDESIVDLPDLTGISVISVEDHPQGAKEIFNSLRSMGAIVESCATYKEGLELIKRRPFDVAVIDQGLPDGLGLDLIKEITEIRPNTGLVMYTVRDDIGLSHSLTALGVTYLTKPASRKGLGEAVKGASSKVAKMDVEGPTKLIIAEDTESVRDILQRQLDKLGVEATFVNNGRTALEEMSAGEYGILLTDLHMPEIDGYGLVEIIRKTEAGTDKHFPVIVLTADVQMSRRETYLSYGFDECLLKPVSLGQLKRLLIRWGLLNEDERSDAATEENVSTDFSNNTAIDKEAVIAQMGSFDDMAIEMIGMFVDMTQPLIDKLEPALKEENYSELAELGHSLKGGARSACCTHLGNVASELQDEAEKNRPVEKIVQKIYDEFDRVKAEVENLSS